MMHSLLQATDTFVHGYDYSHFLKVKHLFQIMQQYVVICLYSYD